MLVSDCNEPLDYRLRSDKVENLDVGDYWIYDKNSKLRYKVERKTFGDLYSSIIDGKMNWQLIDVGALIIDKCTDLYIPRKSKMRPEDYFNFANGIATHHPVFYTLNINHFFSTLRRWERKFNDNTFGEMELRAPKIDANIHVRMLMGLSMMGFERAKSVIENYGSVHAALHHMDSLEIAGIGDGLIGIWMKDLKPIHECPCGVNHGK